MSFPRYPEYKDSGVEWLAKVPTHWEVKRLRRVIDLNPSKSEISAVDKDSPVSFLPMEAVGDDGSLNLERTRAIRDVEVGYTYFRDGDVTFAKITPCFENGKGAVMRNLLQGVGFGTTELVVARPKPQMILSEYLHQIFTSRDFRQLGESVMYGAGGQKRVPDDFVRELYVALPDIEEQAIICEFLKRETLKIDALVVEQERLMTLLKEKRQAVISHAVTKGLDPTVPMKDSGVEWLDEVPAHWEILPLKRDLAFLTSGSRGWAEHYADHGALFIRIGNLTRDEIGLDLSDIQYVDVPIGAEGERTVVRPGDVLFSITAYLGSVAVVPPALDKAYVSQHVALARLRKEKLSPEWVAYVTKSIVGSTYLESQGYGGTKIQLSLGDIANMPMLIPSVSEQKSIVKHISDELEKFDSLLVESKRNIEILKERRASLISAAVTGKIDVRGLVGNAVV